MGNRKPPGLARTGPFTRDTPVAALGLPLVPARIVTGGRLYGRAEPAGLRTFGFGLPWLPRLGLGRGLW